MPIYEYKCPKCNSAFELMRNMSQSDEPAKCPECGYKKASRQLSCFAAGGCGAPAGSGFS